MDEHPASQRNWIAGLSTLTKICIGFNLLAILVIFFQPDLNRLLTPFLNPLFLLFLAVAFVVLVFISLVYIPTRFKKMSWKAFLPLIVNGITFLTVSYLFFPLGNVRTDVEFLVRKTACEKTILWVKESLLRGEIDLGQGSEYIQLPSQYRSAASGGRIVVEKDGDNLIIFFPIEWGLFEYFPGFMYRFAGIAPPDGTLNGDLTCEVQQAPHWYYCH